MTAQRTSRETELEAQDDRQRLDKWLWFARIVKTRSLASRLVVKGRVRVNGDRAINPAKKIRPGDVLTIALQREVKILRVLSPGERRGPFSEAQALLEDLSDPPIGAARDPIRPR